MLFPKFWLRPKSNHLFLHYLLFPATLIWRILIKLEIIFSVPWKSSVPIICIGNVTIGGNGKTPTAMKIRSLLKSRGYTPHILSRGYKSNFRQLYGVSCITGNPWLETLKHTIQKQEEEQTHRVGCQCGCRGGRACGF